MPENDPPQSSVPQVTDKWPKIRGLLPRNAQARLLGGIALLMVFVIGLSGRNAPKDHGTAVPPPAASAVDPSLARIQEYRTRIEEQSRKLSEEQAQLIQTKQALALRGEDRAGRSEMPGGFSTPQAAREKTWIELDREKREYSGLFASNVALTLRPAASTAAPSAGPSEARLPTEAVRVRSEQPDSMERRPMHRLFEGTVIETVLTNRLDSSLTGPVNCMVTTPVYSHDHDKLLVPAGTRLLGEARKLESFGEQRLAVSFHRMVMPDGFSASLDRFQGLSQVGEAGLRDQVNHHYLQVFGVSLAIGAIAGLTQTSTRYGADESASDAYRQGVASSVSQSSLRILDRYLNVLPTFTVREGYRVKVYLSQDLLLPAYDEHPGQKDN